MKGLKPLFFRLILNNIKIRVLNKLTGKADKLNKNTVNNGIFNLLYFKKFLLFGLIFIFFSFVFNARYAEAGVISFFQKILGLEEEEIIPVSSASAIPILEAPSNVDPFSKSTPNVPIVNQDSLLASSGPYGTIVNIQNVPSTKISVYTVRSGDTISGIAEMFNVSVNTIRWSNDLKKNSALKVGDQLVILPISGIQYTVKKGDTVASISKKFGSDEEEILQFNDLDPSKALAAGDAIIVPNGELTEAPQERSKGSAKEQAQKSLRKYASNLPFYDGYFIKPVNGGYRSQGIHGYNGIDLAIYCGAPLYASASGEVIISKSSGWNGGYGKYIVISHANGTQTLYAHANENLVSQGAYVSQGEQIGYVGRTGLATGCHVHFEVRGAKNPF